MMAEAVLLGLDLGTSVLAGCLWSSGGEVLARGELENPQAPLGSDVISRLEAATKGESVRLQALLCTGIEDLVGHLCLKAGCVKGDLTGAAAANPAITHLLSGQPVDAILFPPHRPTFRGGCLLAQVQPQVELGFPLYMMPLISGYVGGDLLAVLLADEQPSEPALYIDLGTNAELALWTGGHWLATSVAAGPAFEAGNLSCGMRYTEGAVKRVSCESDRLQLEVVGRSTPRGLCGSGFFSSITAARSGRLVAADGRIRAPREVEDNLARYLVEDEQGARLLLYRDASGVLAITQEDVRAFQLAKGAVAAGVECLLQRAALAPENISRVFLTGALGNALSTQDLKGVAILPENMLDKVRFLPHAVLAGLERTLRATGGKEQARQLAARVKAYPLSGTPAFEQAFLRALNFSAS